MFLGLSFLFKRIISYLVVLFFCFYGLAGMCCFHCWRSSKVVPVPMEQGNRSVVVAPVDSECFCQACGQSYQDSDIVCLGCHHICDRCYVENKVVTAHCCPVCGAKKVIALLKFDYRQKLKGVSVDEIVAVLNDLPIEIVRRVNATSQLTRLDLSGIKLTTLMFGRIIEFLIMLGVTQGIKILNISNNNVSSIPDSLMAKNFSNLREFYFQGNPLGQDEIRRILGSFPNLRSR
jgi:hypothetical protein